MYFLSPMHASSSLSDDICLCYVHCPILFFFQIVLKLSSTLFHSLEENEVGNSGATTLAGAPRVNQSLTILK